MHLLKLPTFIVTLMSTQFIVFGAKYAYGGSLEKLHRSWEEAEDRCASKFSTHLPSIHSSADQEEIASMMYGNYWIGLRYSEEDNEFQWSDGTDLDYENWYRNEPSNATDDTGSKISQCVVMLRWTLGNNDAPWADVSCDYSAPSWVICNAPLGTLCVSGLSEAYQILNGDWKAIGISEDFPDFEELGTYDNCVDSGHNICWYTLETCTEDSYFMWINPEYGPIIFHQSLDNYDTYISLLDDIIFGCTKDGNWVQDYVDDECDVFDAQWGNNGYENITFTYGECQ